jgi:hypothetical protein
MRRIKGKGERNRRRDQLSSWLTRLYCSESRGKEAIRRADVALLGGLMLAVFCHRLHVRFDLIEKVGA